MAEKRTRHSPPMAERVAGAIGGALLLALLAFTVAQAIRANDSPPDISVETGEVTRTAGGFLVEFTATNRGGRAAARVVIEGRLDADGAEPEVSHATVEDLPRRSSRSGGLLFERDPRSARLTIRARGYEEP